MLDSPTGREVKFSEVVKMLEIIQRDYSEHQLIVASIYKYNLKNKKVIEIKDSLFSMDDFVLFS